MGVNYLDYNHNESLIACVDIGAVIIDDFGYPNFWYGYTESLGDQ